MACSWSANQITFVAAHGRHAVPGDMARWALAAAGKRGGTDGLAASGRLWNHNHFYIVLYNYPIHLSSVFLISLIVDCNLVLVYLVCGITRMLMIAIQPSKRKSLFERLLLPLQLRRSLPSRSRQLQSSTRPRKWQCKNTEIPSSSASLPATIVLTPSP